MSLEERVSRLERQNRRLRLGLGAVMLVLLAGLSMGATERKISASVVEAQKFIVRDKNGKERASLDVSETGSVGLTLYHRDGIRAAAWLGVSKILMGKAAGKDTVELEIFDPKGASNAFFSLNSDPEHPIRLNLYDPLGGRRMALEVEKDGAPSLNFFDMAGKKRAFLVVREGVAGLSLTDGGGKATAFLAAKENGEANFSLVGPQGTPRVVMGLDKSGEAALGITHESGKAAIAIAAAKDTTGLELLDKNGKVRAGLEVTKNGESVLRLHDNSMTHRAQLAVNSSGEPGLTLFDSNKKVRAAFSEKNRLAVLGLYDKDGKQGVSLGVTQDGGTGLVFTDTNGTERVAIAVPREKGPVIGLMDASGKTRWAATEKGAGSLP